MEEISWSDLCMQNERECMKRVNTLNKTFSTGLKSRKKSFNWYILNIDKHFVYSSVNMQPTSVQMKMMTSSNILLCRNKKWLMLCYQYSLSLGSDCISMWQGSILLAGQFKILILITFIKMRYSYWTVTKMDGEQVHYIQGYYIEPYNKLLKQ